MPIHDLGKLLFEGVLYVCVCMCWIVAKIFAIDPQFECP